MQLSKIIFSSAIILGLLVPLKGFGGEPKKPSKHTESEVIGEITSKIHGTIEKLPKDGFIGTWVVKGRTVNVTKETHIDDRQGKIAIGVLIEVEGNTKGNAIDAFEIEVEGDIVHHGKIQSLPKDGFIGTWDVSGKKVIVSKETHIDKEDIDKLVVGATIGIEGKVHPTFIEAYEIELFDPKK